ncbi:hypothetical protein PF008_g30447 [Phytophthora fragariae]|uniref:Fibronectin type-III domain-containing protein n=1 Tax=Phytophthora fragariae TaxID=53985 RepID=A0A6G0Q668_9STRA|nr:hypothetical protein PF008_g30447 [Phytophthora fragariae]
MLTVRRAPPSDDGGDAISSYVVQWDVAAAFDSLALTTGTTATVIDATQRSYTITGLTPGTLYYVRVFAKNRGGQGTPQTSTPASLVPAVRNPGKPNTLTLEATNVTGQLREEPGQAEHAHVGGHERDGAATRDLAGARDPSPWLPMRRHAAGARQLSGGRSLEHGVRLRRQELRGAVLGEERLLVSRREHDGGDGGDGCCSRGWCRARRITCRCWRKTLKAWAASTASEPTRILDTI